MTTTAFMKRALATLAFVGATLHLGAQNGKRNFQLKRRRRFIQVTAASGSEAIRPAGANGARRYNSGGVAQHPLINLSGNKPRSETVCQVSEFVLGKSTTIFLLLHLLKERTPFRVYS